MSDRPDRTRLPRLSIELVPKTCWYSNVRSSIPSREWDRIRAEVYLAANHHCELCGRPDPYRSLECHEMWHYDDKERIQTLDRLVALCFSCHEVKHFGLALVKGHEQRALNHLCLVNGWSEIQGRDHIADAFEQWRIRSAWEWTTDLSVLSRYGVSEPVRVRKGKP